MNSLWIHGWATGSRIFAPVLNSLDPSQPDKSSALDLPGYAHQYPGGEIPDYSAWIVDQVSSFNSQKSLLIAGWSLGGMLALEAAAAAPDMVSALVLISTCARFVRDEANEYGQDPRVLRAMLRRLGRDSGAVTADFHAAMFAPGESGFSEKFIAEQGKEYAKISAQSLATGLNYLLETDLRGKLAGLTCPVLVIHGGDDRVIDIRLGRRLAGSIPGSTFVELKGAGHAPLLTRADECARRIGAFMDSSGKR